MADDSPLSRLRSVPDFYLRNRNLFPSEGAVRWHLRERHQNGLIESGAVVELRTKPDATRAKIFIDEDAWLRWMRDRGMLGVAIA